MAELPRGTVTLLFTDIEGSTRMLQELGRDEYVHALRDHRRLLREAFTRHGGVEVEMQGDSFFFAFAHAGDAVRAAMEGQRALEDHAWSTVPVRVRIGIHTGEPIVSDGLYAGLDVHRAARVMSAGHGGQVLITESTRSLLVDDPAMAPRDLGAHRLKDLAAPVRLYQAGDGAFPAPKSLKRTNLPVQPTPLVGRERELEELLELLARVRLLTLVGAGGIGKTRLALQLAAESVEAFEDGVWWVPLAGLSDPGLVEPAIGAALGVQESVADRLRSARALLLLDNFEHLLDAAPSVAALLDQAQGVRVIATSRAPLHITSEQQYPVPPLEAGDAVRLFEERARMVKPSFVADEHVDGICRRLDCLPLALELAAARVKVLPPARLAERLDRALPLLSSGARDAPQRHRGLRATIEWSHELLTDDERRALARLAVFAGSFSAEGAEDVCDVSLEALESLVDKSLLRETDAGRFFFLETIREFAAERLAQRGEVDELHRRLVGFLLGLARRLGEYGGSGAEARRSFASEEASFRAALTWAAARGEPDPQLDLLAASWPFWWYRGHAAEGLRWVETALATANGEDSPRAVQVLAAGAMFAYRGGWSSDLDRFSKDALAAARRLGDPAATLWPLILRALWASSRGDYPLATRLYEEAIELAAAVGDRKLIGIASNNLGSNAMEQKRYEEAIELLERALSISRELMTPDEIALETLNLAECLYRTGRTTEAVVAAKDGLALASETESLTTLSYGFVLLGALAHHDRAPVAAATLLGVAERLGERVGEPVENDAELNELFEATSERLARSLGEQRVAEARSAGRAMPLERAVEYALASIG